METQEMVYQIFVVYVFIKTLFFAPLLWITFCIRLKERRQEALALVASPATQAPQKEHAYQGALIEQLG